MCITHRNVGGYADAINRLIVFAERERIDEHETMGGTLINLGFDLVRALHRPPPARIGADYRCNTKTFYRRAKNFGTRLAHVVCENRNFFVAVEFGEFPYRRANDFKSILMVEIKNILIHAHKQSEKIRNLIERAADITTQINNHARVWRRRSSLEYLR